MEVLLVVLNPGRHPTYVIIIICMYSESLVFIVTAFSSFSWHDIWYSCLTSFSEWSPKCYLKSAAIMDTIKKNREANFGPSPWSRTPRTWDAPTTKLQLHLHRIIHHRATELHPIWTHSIRQNRGCQRQVGKLFGTTVTFFMFGTNSVQWRNTSTARAVPNNRFLPWRNTWEMFVNDFILFRKCKWWWCLSDSYKQPISTPIAAFAASSSTVSRYVYIQNAQVYSITLLYSSTTWFSSV